MRRPAICPLVARTLFVEHGLPLSHLRERVVGAGRILVITEQRDERPAAIEMRDI